MACCPHIDTIAQLRLFGSGLCLLATSLTAISLLAAATYPSRHPAAHAALDSAVRHQLEIPPVKKMTLLH
jgi:hypothetical protein